MTKTHIRTWLENRPSVKTFSVKRIVWESKRNDFIPELDGAEVVAALAEMVHDGELKVLMGYELPSMVMAGFVTEVNGPYPEYIQDRYLLDTPVDDCIPTFVFRVVDQPKSAVTVGCEDTLAASA